MEIKIRRNSVYYSVSVSEGTTTIDLGLMSRDELTAFCKEIKSVADEWLPEEEKESRHGG